MTKSNFGMTTESAVRAAFANVNRGARSLGKGCQVLLVAASLAMSGQAHAQSAQKLELVVPAYFDAQSDPADWNALTTSAASTPTTAILNPDNGPGKRADSGYVSAIAKVHAAGGKVIGYVSTKYGKRALSAVVQDINLYTQMYQIDGFFIDEMTSDSTTAHLQFYQSIYNYIKGLSAHYQVTGNPGTNVPELYASLPLADQLVVFEDNAKAYTKFKPSAWQSGYPVSRFVHMVYNVPAASLPGVVQFAAANGAGGLYVTSLTLPNPYAKLPPYWAAETTDAAAGR